MSIKKILLIAVAVVLGAAAILFGSMAYKFKSETKKMTPLATGEIVPGVFAVQDDFLNIYLVKTDNGYIAFDGGNDNATIEAGLKMLGIAPADVRALFLTHADGDHVAAASLFTRADIYLSGDEEQMINGTTARGPFMKNKLEKEHKSLKDGQIVTLHGTTVAGYLAPGHTPGSMCFLVNGENLFTGDTLSLKNGKVGLFNEFFNMDTAAEKKSISRIAGLPGVKRIFTAHYGYAPDFTAAFSDWK